MTKISSRKCFKMNKIRHRDNLNKSGNCGLKSIHTIRIVSCIFGAWNKIVKKKIPRKQPNSWKSSPRQNDNEICGRVQLSHKKRNLLRQNYCFPHCSVYLLTMMLYFPPYFALVDLTLSFYSFCPFVWAI